MEECANSAYETARRLLEMADADRKSIKAQGRLTGSALQVHHALMTRPINTIAGLAAESTLSVPTVTSALEALTGLGLVRELTGRKRGRVFSYARYLAVLTQGTEREER